MQENEIAGEMKKKSSDNQNSPGEISVDKGDEEILFLMKKRKDENEALKKILTNLNTSPSKNKDKKEK